MLRLAIGPVIEFLDTSILVAGSLAFHVHHARSFPILRRASPEHTFCSTHSIAEFYATTTRLPLPQRRLPAEVLLMLRALRERVTFVELTATEYMETVESLAQQYIPGAQIYDALLIAAARKVRADVVYTWNLKHFRPVAPDLAERILEPGS